jgi:hypothetical protein
MSHTVRTDVDSKFGLPDLQGEGSRVAVIALVAVAEPELVVARLHYSALDAAGLWSELARVEDQVSNSRGSSSLGRSTGRIKS